MKSGLLIKTLILLTLCHFFIEKPKEQTEPFFYLLGDYTVYAYLPSDKESWLQSGLGKASFTPIFDSTYVVEKVFTDMGEWTLTMQNTFGIDKSSGKVKIFTIDKEFGTMDTYVGKVDEDRVSVNNLSSDSRFISPSRESLAFRLTYSKLNDESNQLIVESTHDEGKSWKPYVKYIYQKRI
ncbi:hypothetical protein BFP97_15740 [Roseivirga sp. 4D4]|uniref:DUF1579 family protein n=1 Tax=Roseivirga sp. 4D4 TaxID=1889784 RepID=UPI000852E651|nr:DUF1579 family protein [Roseivirga sp. 4D4]OEK02886.1 hypothetical protein BFP97_15740 [Roseivirga sp. 4D4]